ncbi:hypothetical protein REH65_03930 [Saccharopolyspora sp. ID03-671]
MRTALVNTDSPLGDLAMPDSMRTPDTDVEPVEALDHRRRGYQA